jgi:hypothetical protein
MERQVAIVQVQELWSNEGKKDEIRRKDLYFWKLVRSIETLSDAASHQIISSE